MQLGVRLNDMITYRSVNYKSLLTLQKYQQSIKCPYFLHRYLELQLDHIKHGKTTHLNTGTLRLITDIVSINDAMIDAGNMDKNLTIT